MAQTEPPPGTRVRPVNAGGVSSLLISPPEDVSATVLYLHGGGYVFGSAFGYRPHAGALAAAANSGVVVPDYRLAPEHPFPAALEDAMSAYRWMLERAIEPERITLAGDSSGGGLVLSLLLTLAAQGVALPGAVVLMCPFLDLALRLKREPDAVEVPVVTDDEMRNCVTMYLAGHPIDDPVVDPLSADLTGLPPMLIQAATGDARLADAKTLAARARRYGVDARLQLFPVDAHAFHLFWSFLPEAADAMQAAGEFIRGVADNALVEDGASTPTAGDLRAV